MAKSLFETGKPGCGGRGRPRCEAARGRILASAYDQLAVRGWEAFTIERVANEAGCSKATVYRWWTDRHDLAVDAFLSQSCPSDGLPDTGCLYCDLEEQIFKVVECMTGDHANVLKAVFMAVQEKPDLFPELEARWSPLRRLAMEKIVENAVSRGQLPEGTDVDRMFQMVFGPVMMGVVFGKPMAKDEVRGVVSQVLASFGFRAGGIDPGALDSLAGAGQSSSTS